MKPKTVLIIVAAALLQFTTVSAEEALRSENPTEIFNSIMQTMPGDMKDQIDSAATTQRTANDREQQHLSNGSDRQPPESRTFEARQATIDQLPESVREQVRKTMQELEQGTAQRMLQFKESQNQHKEN